MSALNQAWVDYKLRANKVSLLDAAKMCGAKLKPAGGGDMSVRVLPAVVQTALPSMIVKASGFAVVLLAAVTQ